MVFVRICFKALPGLRSRQQCVLLPSPHHLVDERPLTRAGHKVLSTCCRWFLLFLDLNTVELGVGPFWDSHELGGCQSLRQAELLPSCQRSVLLEQVRSPWAWQERSGAGERFLKSSSSCPVALGPPLHQQRWLLAMGFLRDG